MKMFNLKTKKKNNDIVAIADGELIDVKTVSDPVFAEKMMGESIAFKFTEDKVILCSPATGVLTVLFPTAHAYGIKMNNGVEILIHIGVNTVESKGKGFTLLGKQQGDSIKAGEPVVEVDFKELRDMYDMSTILIITNANGQTIDFIEYGIVTHGQKIIK